MQHGIVFFRNIAVVFINNNNETLVQTGLTKNNRL